MGDIELCHLGPSLVMDRELDSCFLSLFTVNRGFAVENPRWTSNSYMLIGHSLANRICVLDTQISFHGSADRLQKM